MWRSLTLKIGLMMRNHCKSVAKKKEGGEAEEDPRDRFRHIAIPLT
jgi:hypothetical protein